MKKILAVDDSSFICELLESRLKANGYEVITALDGETAIAKVKSDKPDLILLDITMPQMSGIEVACELKDNSETAAIPIIIVTAKGSNMLDAESSCQGIAGYVAKPFEPEELLDEIKRVLDKK